MALTFTKSGFTFLVIVFGLFLLAPDLNAEQKPSIGIEQVFLYQSDEIHRARALDAKELSEYILAIESVVSESKTLGVGPEVLEVVVAVRPGKLSRVWFVSSLSTIPERSSLAKEIQSLEAIEVVGGPIAFALRFGIGSVSSEELEDTGDWPPLPLAWEEILQTAEERLSVDQILEEVWVLSESEEEAFAAFLESHEFPVPEGFRLQLLQPLGGKVAMPKDWKYAGWQEGKKLVWLIAKDIGERGDYQTGMKIQFFVGMQGGKEAGKNFLKQREAEASKVHLKYDPVSFGMFTREGVQVESTIEKEKGPELHRVVYSIFWTADGSMLAVMSSGCLAQEWDQYSEIFDVMQRIELIDPEVVEKLANGED